jgi:NADH-quinone oxidoreductase subunit J
VAQGRTSTIGTDLFREYLVPFEVVSMLLLAALIGAVVLARRD